MKVLNGDIKLVLPTLEGWDLKLNETETDLETDISLKNALILSLLVKGRAQLEDGVKGDDQGGWWGNAIEPVSLVSRVWVNLLGKILPTTLYQVESHTLDALAWMKDSGVVSDITCTATRTGANRIDWNIVLKKPDLSEEKYIFNLNWEKSLARDTNTTIALEV